MKRYVSKWHWLLWSILLLALLLTEAVIASSGAAVAHYKQAASSREAGTLSQAPGAGDRGETAIVRVYPPPSPNSNPGRPGSSYFPGATAIYAKGINLTCQGYAFISLVIGLFARFYGSARNSAGVDGAIAPAAAFV